MQLDHGRQRGDLRREAEAYVEDDPKFGHDFGFPYLMEQAGLRAVYEPEAIAVEKPASEPEDEYGRKVRTIARSWGHVLTGRMFRPTRPLYLAELVSHRVLRYSSGLLHVALLVSNVALLRRGVPYRLLLAAQLGGLALAAAGRHASRSPVPASPTTTTSSPRRLSRGSSATSGRERRRRGTRPRGPGEPRGRRRARRRRARSDEPALGLAALASKLEDRGPVLYRQTRVGRDGEDFELLKLRTMVVGAETMGAGYAVDQGDPRITRLGRILRRTSIDELPQLWNVLRGDMSVIGPRPTLRYQVEQYDERQRRRLDVKPGLTGWAQVQGRAALPWAERIELDVWYVEHRSPRVDLGILLRTPLALFRGTYRGATGGWR